MYGQIDGLRIYYGQELISIEFKCANSSKLLEFFVDVTDLDITEFEICDSFIYLLMGWMWAGGWRLQPFMCPDPDKLNVSAKVVVLSGQVLTGAKTNLFL